jgi:hypothetical protein
MVIGIGEAWDEGMVGKEIAAVAVANLILHSTEIEFLPCQYTR